MFRNLMSLLLMGFLPFASFAGDGNTNTVVSGNSDSDPGLKCILSIPKSTFTNGESIPAVCLLTNTSGSAQNITYPRVGGNWFLNVTDHENLAVAPKKVERSYINSGPFWISISSHGTLDLPIEINGFFDLKPDTYHISAWRDLTLRPPLMQTVVTSDVVTITIMEGAKK